MYISSSPDLEYFSVDDVSDSNYILVPASSTFKTREGKETKCTEHGGFLLAMETFDELASFGPSLLGKNYPYGYEIDLAAKDLNNDNKVYWTPSNTLMDYGGLNFLALGNVKHNDGDCLIFKKKIVFSLHMSHCDGHETDFVCEIPV